MSNEMGYFRGIVTGLLLGAAGALLLTPKRGEELRHELAEGASKLKDKAGDLSGTVAETVVEKSRELKERGEELVGAAHGSDNTLIAAADEKLADVKDSAQDKTHDVVDSV